MLTITTLNLIKNELINYFVCFGLIRPNIALMKDVVCCMHNVVPERLIVSLASSSTEIESLYLWHTDLLSVLYVPKHVSTNGAPCMQECFYRDQILIISFLSLTHCFMSSLKLRDYTFYLQCKVCVGFSHKLFEGWHFYMISPFSAINNFTRPLLSCEGLILLMKQKCVSECG